MLGIDPFNRADIAYPNGLRIEKRDIFSEHGQWDLVMFHHSFEHLPKRRLHLQQAFQHPQARGYGAGAHTDGFLLRLAGIRCQLGATGCAAPPVPTFRQKHGGAGGTMRLPDRNSGVRLNALQFWGSKQYEQGIPLRDPHSWAESPQNAFYQQKYASLKSAQELNAINQGDQAAFI
ncbi:MAG: hypothetical protein R3E93_07720 [Thiothrix sp.]